MKVPYPPPRWQRNGSGKWQYSEKKNKRVKTFNGNERKVKGKRKKEVDMKE
jgi:hypothetical protein